MNRHTGWRTVWRIYPLKNLYKGIIKPIILTSCTCFICFISEKSSLEHIDFLCDVIITTFPSIIGFILTAYALIIGFSSSDIISYLAKSGVNKKYSLFQIVNSTFAVVMGFMICTFLIGAFCSFIQQAEIPFLIHDLTPYFNGIVLFVLIFCFFYSICSLLDIIINIFNLGQFANILAKRKDINKST